MVIKRCVNESGIKKGQLAEEVKAWGNKLQNFMITYCFFGDPEISFNQLCLVDKLSTQFTIYTFNMTIYYL